MKNIFSIIILASALLLTGCGEGDNSKVTDPSSEPIKKEIEASIQKSELKECLKGCEVFEEGNGLLSKGMCIDTCWTEEAKLQKDIAICDEKVSPDNALMQSGCRLNVAEATLNSEHCDTIKDGIMKLGCYSSLANKTKDETICEKITDGMMKMICIEGIEDVQ